MLDVRRRWYRDTDTLAAAVRRCFTYENGSGRWAGYVYSDGVWAEPLAELGPEILDGIADEVDVRPTIALIQAYRDGTASCDWHNDDSFDFQAILSIGVTRRFAIRRGDIEAVCTLDNGDLVVMPSGFQLDWEHRMLTDPDVSGERLALVFRTPR